MKCLEPLLLGLVLDDSCQFTRTIDSVVGETQG